MSLIPARRYLIVDDNVAFAENLAEILREEGHEAMVTSSGPEALKAVKAEKFDAVLTDMRMPAMSGAQFVHELRGIDPGLPAIVATAYSGDDDLKVARNEGLLAIVSKPLPLKRVLSLLHAARRNGLVALIEDDEALSDNLSEALRIHGLTVVSAKSISEARRFGAARPFASLVDLRVPGGAAGDAMRVLAARYPGLPMLVITAHDDLPPLTPTAIFRKPFATEALLQKLESLYASNASTP